MWITTWSSKGCCGTGSLESMGSRLDSISCLRMSSIGEMAYTGSGDPPGAAPTCSELKETVNSEVNTSVSEMGNFDLMDSGLESIPCSGMSSVDTTTSSREGDPPSAAPSGHIGSKLKETAMRMRRSTHSLARESRTWGFSRGHSSFREVVPGWDHRCQQDSHRHPGLWALVVDAAPCDVRPMSDGLLAAMIQEDDT